jgi:hypothetical protein
VPDHDHPIELHNLLLEAEQLIAERGKARSYRRILVTEGVRRQRLELAI